MLDVVAARHQVLLQAEDAPQALCAPALDLHSSPLLSSLSSVLGVTQRDTVPGAALHDKQQVKNTFLDLLANSCLTAHVAGLHHHKDVLLPCLPACILCRAGLQQIPSCAHSQWCCSHPEGQRLPSRLAWNPFPYMLDRISREPHFHQPCATSLCR